MKAGRGKPLANVRPTMKDYNPKDYSVHASPRADPQHTMKAMDESGSNTAGNPGFYGKAYNDMIDKSFSGDSEIPHSNQNGGFHSGADTSPRHTDVTNDFMQHQNYKAGQPWLEE